MKKFIILFCTVLFIGCNSVIESLNVSDGSKLIITTVEKQGEVYWYHLNKEGHTKLIFDEYGYLSPKRYNVGDTLIIKIDLYKERYDTIH